MAGPHQRLTTTRRGLINTEAGNKKPRCLGGPGLRGARAQGIGGGWAVGNAYPLHAQLT
jgi:hypothetical protein